MGQWVEGLVTGVTDFGAFVELPGRVEGLLYVSEIAEGAAANVQEMLRSGDKLQVKILRVEPERRRIKLSTHDWPT